MDTQLLQTYYRELTGHTYDEARLMFQQLKIVDSNSGNLFFQTYGVPNIIERPEIPYERFACYEHLLNVLHEENGKKFNEIHKGTPYYFLAWLSFDIKNYERAVYYMDCALCEDQRNFPRKWLTTPGTSALLLNTDMSGPVKRVVVQLRGNTEEQISRFNLATGSHLLVDSLYLNILTDLCHPTNKNSTRSILTSFHSFLYEYKDLVWLIKVGNAKGSLEPILINLFKGCLVFESLLKHLYPDIQAKTLRDLLTSKVIEDNFGLKTIKTEASNIEEVLESAKDDSVRSAFSTTAKIRNFSGHDLARENELNDNGIYIKLCNQVLNALFYVLQRHYL